MAVSSQRPLAYNIGASVQSRIKNVVASKQGARLEEERRFQALVGSRDLSLEDQLAFRQEQLKKEMESSVQDAAFITEIKADIGALQKSVRSDRYRKAYFNSFTAWKSGLKPVQDHIDFLQNQLSQVNDPTLAAEIRQSLSEARVSQKTAEDSILDNYVSFAQNDKTAEVLQQAIDRVHSAKARATLGGDGVRASVLDLKEQSLRQSLAQSNIEVDGHKFELSRLKAAHPVKTLDLLGETMKSADASTPVTVNGKQYLNAQDYWTNQRNEYVANGDFFKDYTNYYGAWIDSTISRNPDLAAGVLSQVNDTTKLLLSRPELKGFENGLNNTSATVFKKGVDTLVRNYLDQADLDFDFAGAARKIESLGLATGLDVQPYQNDLIGRLANIKAPIANAIIQLAADYSAKGYKMSAALDAATKQYKSGELLAAPVSPKDIANKTPEQVAREAGGLNPAAPAAPAPSAPAPQPGSVPGTETMTTEKSFIPQTSSSTTTQTSSTTTTTPVPPPPKPPPSATLYNPKAPDPFATRVGVVIGSEDEKKYFGQGYVLETKPPKQ